METTVNTSKTLQSHVISYRHPYKITHKEFVKETSQKNYLRGIADGIMLGLLGAGCFWIISQVVINHTKEQARKMTIQR